MYMSVFMYVYVGMCVCRYVLCKYVFLCVLYITFMYYVLMSVCVCIYIRT